MADSKLIVWKDEYAVGHAELDEHHRTMFTIINDLHAGMMGGASDPEMRALFKRTRAYAQLHFSREEELLRDSAYPRLAEHQRAHRAYVERVEALIQPTLGSDEAVAADMLAFLKDWWLNHILRMDHRYAPFLAAREQLAPGESPGPDTHKTVS